MRIRVALQQVKRSRNTGAGGRRCGAVLALAMLMLGAVACTPSGTSTPPAQPSIEDAQDLINVLRAAGVSVQPTSALADPAFGGRGQVLQISGQLVQVHEYEQLEERQAISQAISTGEWPSGADQKLQASTAVWTAGRLIVVYAGTDGGTHLLLQALLGDPITLAPEVVDEPYPAAVPAALTAAADLFGVTPSDIEVIGLEEMVWSDACLGLPETGERCAEVRIPGWRITLRGGGVEAVFRTDEAGERVRVERTVDGS